MRHQDRMIEKVEGLEVEWTDSETEGTGTEVYIETGITATNLTKGVTKQPQKKWYQRKFIYIAGLLLIVIGVAGVVASFMFKEDSGTTSSNNSSSNENPLSPPSGFPPSVPTSEETSAPEPTTTTTTNPPNISPTPSPTFPPVAATAEPSLRPTKGPTLPPTPGPTPLPTPGPTPRPTPSPTPRPTPRPTQRPTPAPTPRPTGLREGAFSFYVMGDVPYAPWQEEVLRTQLEEMTENRPLGSSFQVHVGDLMSWQRTQCVEYYFLNTYNLLLDSPLPTFVLAGDNESIDCPFRDDARQHFMKYFSGNPFEQIGKPFEQHWDASNTPADAMPVDVKRWNEKRPEMFRFVVNDVLFVSINLLNNNRDSKDADLIAELDSLMVDDEEWVRSSVEDAFSKHPIRGVVIFGHAARNKYVKPFFHAVKDIFKPIGFDLPVLYIHGDGHKFDVDVRFSINNNWPGFVDIQVDQGALADPLLVEVAPRIQGKHIPLEEENGKDHYIFGDGLFRIDRQGGLYSER